MGVVSNKITRDELKAGDHIYSWRNAYLYSHHGIYTSEGQVIHFTGGPGPGQEVGTRTILDRIILSSSNQSRFPCTTCVDRSCAICVQSCTKCVDQSKVTGVISSCLDCFLWGGELYRFEYHVSVPFFLAKVRGGTCTRAPSDPTHDILKRASFLLEKGFGEYNIFKNNCEDFAIYCKTGLLVVTDISVGRSGQMSSIYAAINAVVSSPVRLLTQSSGVLAVVGCGMYCVSRLYSDIGMRRDVRKVSVESLVNPIDVDMVVETVTPAMLSCDLDQTDETTNIKKVLAEASQPAEVVDPVVETVTPSTLSRDLDQTDEITTFKKVLAEASQPAEVADPVVETVTPAMLSRDLDQTDEITTFKKVLAEASQPTEVADPVVETVTLAMLSCDLYQTDETTTFKKVFAEACQPAEVADCKKLKED